LLQPKSSNKDFEVLEWPHTLSLCGFFYGIFGEQSLSCKKGEPVGKFESQVGKKAIALNGISLFYISTVKKLIFTIEYKFVYMYNSEN